MRGQGFEERLAQVYTSGEAWKTDGMPIAVQRKPGGAIERRYIDLSYQAYRAQDGGILGIFAQGYDVTEAHDAPEAEHESTERLREGLVAVKMVVWDWELGTDLLYLSDNADQVLGGQSDSCRKIEQCIHLDDRAVLKAARDKALWEKSTYQATVRFQRLDNSATI